jgi:predicted nucleic acid-binding protein
MITYAETWVGVARSKPARREAIAAHVRELMRIEPMTASIAQRGAALRARTGATLADALVIATGQEIDASVILTADGRWKELDRRVMVVAPES